MQVSITGHRLVGCTLFLTLLLATTLIPNANAQEADHQKNAAGHGADMSYGEKTVYLLTSVLLVIFAGMASGLTVGLLSLDPFELHILAAEGTEEERRSAGEVLAVTENHHVLLVTLLLTNAIAMEALPIFLNRLVPAWLAVMLAVTAILAFGEVLPQALCTGPNQLKIATYSVPVVRVLIAALYVIVYPVSKLLDSFFGEHENLKFYSRHRMKTFVKLHQRPDPEQKKRGVAQRLDVEAAETNLPMLEMDEVNVIHGALALAEKTVVNIMIPEDEVFMLEKTVKLDTAVLGEIKSKGHSRIPVYSGYRSNVIGILLVKLLVGIDSSVLEKSTIENLLIKYRVPFVEPTRDVYDMLNEFQKGTSHIAFIVTNPSAYNEEQSSVDKYTASQDRRLLGICTLEDILEELIQEEILDEFDKKDWVQRTPPALTSVCSLRSLARSTPAISSLTTAKRWGSTDLTVNLLERQPSGKTTAVVENRPKRRGLQRPASAASTIRNSAVNHSLREGLLQSAQCDTDIAAPTIEVASP